MAYLIMAVRDGVERELDADTKIAASIHVSAFIADGFTVKVWDSSTLKPVSINGLSSRPVLPG